MKCTSYKYKTSLAQGKREATDAYQAQIIALQTEINNLKTRSKGDQNRINKHHTGKAKFNGKLMSTNQGKQCAKRYYSWQSIPLIPGASTTMQKYGKMYNWCLKVTGAPKEKGCDHWIIHQPPLCGDNTKNQQRLPGSIIVPRIPPNRKTRCIHCRSQRWQLWLNILNQHI